MSANRVLEHAGYNTCTCLAVMTVRPAFDYSAFSITVGDVRPVYVSLTCTASTGGWFLSTGQQVNFHSMPSPSGAFSWTCTTSGGQLSYILMG